MAELGEGAAVPVIKPKYINAAIVEVRFESGIELYELESSGAAKALPPAGTPHWAETGRAYPAVYVREGGAGEVKTLKVKVRWDQQGCDGGAKLEGASADGELKITGDFTVSGAKGEAEASCQFTKRPGVVRNHGRGLSLAWQVTAGGETGAARGGTPLTLFFVDQKPRPIAWLGTGYKSFYLPIADWATQWAEGKKDTAPVLAALWDKFSDGTGARVPHVTGFSYWRTDDPVQNLIELLQPGSAAGRKGWSCTSIAHLFMECLALHGIQCGEVVPLTPPGALMFLVKNWRHDPRPVPNWPAKPEDYYGGTWAHSGRPPLNERVPTSHGWVVDFRKEPGVPAQGQRDAPLGFQNHWIVEVSGKLYDTSYGMVHPSDIARYAAAALAGWLVGVLPDAPPARRAKAWVCHVLLKHRLMRIDRARN